MRCVPKWCAAANANTRSTEPSRNGNEALRHAATPAGCPSSKASQRRCDTTASYAMSVATMRWPAPSSCATAHDAHAWPAPSSTIMVAPAKTSRNASSFSSSTRASPILCVSRPSENAPGRSSGDVAQNSRSRCSRAGPNSTPLVVGAFVGIEALQNRAVGRDPQRLAERIPEDGSEQRDRAPAPRVRARH